MPSSPTTRNRLEKQGTGENLNTWGAKLNSTGLDLIDAAIDGRATFTLSGSKTLSSTNYAADEARMRFLDITSGTGGTVTIPAVEKLYLIRNATSGSVIVTTGSGDTATVPSGNTQWVASDGTNVRLETPADFGAVTVKSTAVPSAAGDLVNKAYADSIAFSATLPGQAGNAGKYLTTDGTTASWSAIADSVTISGAQTVTGLKTFSMGVVINGQTLDGLTATGLALAETASAAAARTTLGLGTMAVATATDYVSASATQTVTGLKTFGSGVIINGQTLNGLTATGVSLAHAASAAAARTVLGVAPQWTLLSTTTIAAPAASVIQADLAGYKEVMILCLDPSHNDAGNRYIDLSLSTNNGSSYGAGNPITATRAASSNANVGITIFGLDTGSPFAVAADAGAAFATMHDPEPGAAVTAVRLQWSAGSWDSGTIKFYAR